MFCPKCGNEVKEGDMFCAKTECSGNTIGIYLRQGGLVLLGDLVPDLLGGTYNERNRMNAIIKGGCPLL